MPARSQRRWSKQSAEGTRHPQPYPRQAGCPANGCVEITGWRRSGTRDGHRLQQQEKVSPPPTSRTTWVASAPDLGWRPSIYFRKHGVEATQAAKASMRGNLRHRKVGLVEKPLGPLDAGGLSDLHRAGAQVPLEQPGQM